MSELPPESDIPNEFNLEGVEIEIVNFEKHQRASRAKKHDWFALDVDFLTHRKIQKLNPKQVLLFLQLLSDASRKKTKCIYLNAKVLSLACRSNSKSILKSLFLMQDIDLIKVHTQQSAPYIREEKRREEKRREEKNIYTAKSEDSTAPCAKKSIVKKTKKAKKTTPKVHIDFTEKDFKLAYRWIDYAKSKMPHLKLDSDLCANELAVVKKYIKFTDDEMGILFEWICQDDFWSMNAISPMGLRKKSKTNDLKKIDNIVRSFKTDYEKYLNKTKGFNEFLQSDDGGAW